MFCFMTWKVMEDYYLVLVIQPIFRRSISPKQVSIVKRISFHPSLINHKCTGSVPVPRSSHRQNCDVSHSNGNNILASCEFPSTSVASGFRSFFSSMTQQILRVFID